MRALGAPRPPPTSGGGSRRPGGAGGCQTAVSPRPLRAFSFNTPSGLSCPVDSRACWTPWSVFQDGPGGPPASSRRGRETAAPPHRTSADNVRRAASGKPERGHRRAVRRGRRRVTRGVSRVRSSCTTAGRSTRTPGPRPPRRTGLIPGPYADTQRVATPYKGRSALGARRGRRARPRRRPPRGRIDAWRRTRRRTRPELSLPVRHLGLHPFTPERFHVLLNSLFKVLFNFPSRYLFAIGHVVVFSL